VVPYSAAVDAGSFVVQVSVAPVAVIPPVETADIVGAVVSATVFRPSFENALLAPAVFWADTAKKYVPGPSPVTVYEVLRPTGMATV
jgi:hypothetical protein